MEDVPDQDPAQNPGNKLKLHFAYPRNPEFMLLGYLSRFPHTDKGIVIGCLSTSLMLDPESKSGMHLERKRPINVYPFNGYHFVFKLAGKDRGTHPVCFMPAIARAHFFFFVFCRQGFKICLRTRN